MTRMVGPFGSTTTVAYLIWYEAFKKSPGPAFVSNWSHPFVIIFPVLFPRPQRRLLIRDATA